MLGFTTQGAFAEYIVINEKYCWQLNALKDTGWSDDQIYEAGALIEPLGCTYNGIFVSGGGFMPGANAAVYGAGPIGLAAVMLLRAAGAARIMVFDISQKRNQLALQLGADYVESPEILNQSGRSISDVIREKTNGRGADIQIEAAGAASVLMPEINKSFAPNGKMIYLGRHDGEALIEFNTLVSQANQIVGARGHAGRGIFGNLIELLVNNRITVDKIITSRFPFENVLEAFRHASRRDEGKVMVNFP